MNKGFHLREIKRGEHTMFWKPTSNSDLSEQHQKERDYTKTQYPLPNQVHRERYFKDDSLAFSETKSITEHFSNIDELGNKVTGMRTTVTEHSESASTQRVPFSYADAVKKKAAAEKQIETYDEAFQLIGDTPKGKNPLSRGGGRLVVKNPIKKKKKIFLW